MCVPGRPWLRRQPMIQDTRHRLDQNVSNAYIHVLPVQARPPIDLVLYRQGRVAACRLRCLPHATRSSYTVVWSRCRYGRRLQPYGCLSGSLSPISVVRSEIELLTAVGLKSQLAAATYRTCCDVSNDPVRLLSAVASDPPKPAAQPPRCVELPAEGAEQSVLPRVTWQDATADV